MSKKQGSKSGSPQRRQPKPAARTSSSIALSAEARRILDEGMNVAGRFASYSPLSRETLVERFVRLITTYGPEMCYAALKEVISSRDNRLAMYWCDPAFGALAKLGLLKEALSYMRRLGSTEGQRIAALSMMVDFADPATRDLILTQIEQLAAQTSDVAARTHAHYNLIGIDGERYKHLAPRLHAAYQDLYARAERLTEAEARLLVTVSCLWTSVESFQDLVRAIGRIQRPAARTEGETTLIISLARVSQERLNELADAVPGSRVEARIREMARVARTRQEQDDADSANAP